MTARVLIVDDHAPFRARARALLEADGFEVVGEAADGEAAVAAAQRLRPDVVLLDVQLPGIDGFAVAERLAAEAEPPAVVLISSRGARRVPAPAGDQPGARVHREGGAVGRVPVLAAGLTAASPRRRDRGRRARAASAARRPLAWLARRARRIGSRGSLHALAGGAWFAGDLWARCSTSTAGRSSTCCSPIRPDACGRGWSWVVIAVAYVDGAGARAGARPRCRRSRCGGRCARRGRVAPPAARRRRAPRARGRAGRGGGGGRRARDRAPSRGWPGATRRHRRAVGVRARGGRRGGRADRGSALGPLGARRRHRARRRSRRAPRAAGAAGGAGPRARRPGPRRWPTAASTAANGSTRPGAGQLPASGGGARA